MTGGDLRVPIVKYAAADLRATKGVSHQGLNRFFNVAARLSRPSTYKSLPQGEAHEIRGAAADFTGDAAI